MSVVGQTFQPRDDGLKGVSDNRPPFEKSSEKSMVEILQEKRVKVTAFAKNRRLDSFTSKGGAPSTAFSGHLSRFFGMMLTSTALNKMFASENLSKK